MTMSLAIPLLFLVAGLGVLVAALAWGEAPEEADQYSGRSPFEPVLRDVIAIEVAGEVVQTPTAPSGRHA